MAINWNYNSDDYQEQSFSLIPAGDHRVRIKSAEETKAKESDRDMIKLTLEVSGHSGHIWHNIVFMPDNPTMTNQKLGQVFDSFNIQPGNMNIASWVGKVGGARVKHRTYNNSEREEIAYFLSRSRVDALPAWQDTPGKASVTGGNYTEIAPEDELPFQIIKERTKKI